MIPIILVADDKTADSYLKNYISDNKYTMQNIFETFPLKKEIVLIQIKEVQKLLQRSSVNSRLFIFRGFNTAAAEVQNALLKSLEDYSANNQFILVAENEHLIFPTIRSRSKTIKLSESKTKTKHTEDLSGFVKLVENSQGYNFLSHNSIKTADRDNIIALMDELLIIYRSRLSNETEPVKIIKKILSLRTLILTNNLNPQFAYDNLLIFIAKVFRMKI